MAATIIFANPIGANAAEEKSTSTPATTTQAAAWPTTIQLAKGLRPEGIAIKGNTAFVTSYFDGSIARLDLRTGQQSAFSPKVGKGAIGLLLDAQNRIFVAGGYGGDLRVINADNGETIATYQLANESEGTIINDLVMLDGSLYVTDSTVPVLYKLPFGADGALPKQEDVTRIPYDGVTFQGEGWTGWNINGITPTPDGKALLVVQTNKGLLYRVNPKDGKAVQVDIVGGDISWGDGMMLEGNLLYVVRNTVNTLSVFKLNDEGTQATLVSNTTDARFDTPTTLARHGDRLYLTNAHFMAENPAETQYEIISIPAPKP